MDFKNIPGDAMEASETDVGADIRGLSDVSLRGNSKTILTVMAGPARALQAIRSARSTDQADRSDGSVGPVIGGRAVFTAALALRKG